MVRCLRRRTAKRMTSKKDLIYEGALKAFSEHEFSETTMDYIAEISSVAKGTLYYHFQTKEDLFIYVMEKGISKLLEQVDLVIAGDYPRDDMLTQLLKVHLKFYDEEKEFCQLLFGKIWGTHIKRITTQELLEHYFQTLETLFGELQEEGYISMDIDIPTLTSSLFGMIGFTALRRIIKGEPVYTQEVKLSMVKLCRGVLKSGDLIY
jgi:AcrR family transcriptional regulator